MLGVAEWLRRWIWNRGNVSARVSRHIAFFLIHFLCFLFLFSSTVFGMHPYFGTVSSLERIKYFGV